MRHILLLHTPILAPNGLGTPRYHASVIPARLLLPPDRVRRVARSEELRQAVDWLKTTGQIAAGEFARSLSQWHAIAEQFELDLVVGESASGAQPAQPSETPELRIVPGGRS